MRRLSMIMWNNALILLEILVISKYQLEETDLVKSSLTVILQEQRVYEPCFTYFLKCNYLQIADLQSRLLIMVEP